MKRANIRWQLVVYDLLILLAAEWLLLVFYNHAELTPRGIAVQVLLTWTCVLVARLVGRVYKQIWRYGGIQCYIRLLVTDGCACLVNVFLENFLQENILVPLMEHNCIEAVENNVFGTKNLVELCEVYGAERFMMVSADKAVNPTRGANHKA